MAGIYNLHCIIIASIPAGKDVSVLACLIRLVMLNLLMPVIKDYWERQVMQIIFTTSRISRK